MVAIWPSAGPGIPIISSSALGNLSTASIQDDLELPQGMPMNIAPSVVSAERSKEQGNTTSIPFVVDKSGRCQS